MLRTVRQHRDIFDEYVAQAFLHNTCKMVIEAYENAFEDCESRFDRPEAHDALPILRRALIEQNWRALANRFQGIRGTARTNKTESNYHTRISAGPVILTESAVDSPSAIVRQAGFRLSYAGAEQQLVLGNLVDSTQGSNLFAILIHGAHPKNPSLPGFIHIVFPAADCNSYIDRINLLDRFEDLGDIVSRGHRAAIEAPAVALRPTASGEIYQQGS